MNTSLTSLNQEFKEYENIDFRYWCFRLLAPTLKKNPLLSKVAKRIICVQDDFSASGYCLG